MGKRELTNEQAFKIAQAAASLSIEGMQLTEEDYRNLADVATGKKTEEQMAEELTERYQNG